MIPVSPISPLDILPLSQHCGVVETVHDDLLKLDLPLLISAAYSKLCVSIIGKWLKGVTKYANNKILIFYHDPVKLFEEQFML